MMRESFLDNITVDHCVECGLPNSVEVCDYCDEFICDDCLLEVGAYIFCSNQCVDDNFS